jgi:hypothetical protein
MEPSSLVPEPGRLGLEPLLSGSPVICLGVAAIFGIVLILYFLLRGRRHY